MPQETKQQLIDRNTARMKNIQARMKRQKKWGDENLTGEFRDGFLAQTDMMLGYFQDMTTRDPEHLPTLGQRLAAQRTLIYAMERTIVLLREFHGHGHGPAGRHTDGMHSALAHLDLDQLFEK